VIEEKSRSLVLGGSAGPKERRVVVLVGSIDLGSTLKEELHRLDMATMSRPMKRSAAVL
jgi:hypothetical protein